MNTKQNANTIHIWRVIFTLMVAIMHFNNIYYTPYERYGITMGWNVSVDFFFIVSGFLLLYKFDPEKTAAQYTVKRVKKLWPHFLFSFAILFVVRQFLMYDGLKNLVKNILSSVYEIAGIKMAGYDFGIHYNWATWYISVMMIIGYLIYWLLKEHYKLFTQIIAPLAPILIYSYFMRVRGGITDMKIEGLFMNDYLLRGLAGMSMGCVCYLIYTKLKQCELKKYGIVLSIVEFLGYAGVIVFSLRYGQNEFDFVCIYAIAGLIVLSFLNNRMGTLMQSKPIQYLDSLSYPIYLNHVLIGVVLFPLIGTKVSFFSEWSLKLLVVYVITIIVYSSITKMIVDFITKKIFRK